MYHLKISMPGFRQVSISKPDKVEANEQVTTSGAKGGNISKLLLFRVSHNVNAKVYINTVILHINLSAKILNKNLLLISDI